MEDTRIFQWFVFALGNAQQDDFGGLAKVVAGGTNKIANVFDQQQTWSSRRRAMLDDLKAQARLSY